MRRLRMLGARLPIRWRLALTFFALFVLLLSVLGIFISLIVEQTLLSNEAILLHNEARLVADDIHTRGPSLFFPINHASVILVPPASTQAQLSPTETRFTTILLLRLSSANTDVCILAPDGHIVASSASLGDPDIPPVIHLNEKVVQQALISEQKFSSYLMGVDSQKGRQLIILVPIVDNQRMVAVLQVGTRTSLIDRSVSEVRWLLVLGITAAIVIAAALTLPLVGATLRPLVVMERASRQIAEGDLSLRLEVPLSKDEIGRLAQSFNRMVARLEAAFTRQKQFVSDVSHELRTPLTVLSGSLEMLLIGANQGDEAAARRLLRSMYADVGRLQRLVADLLVLARLDEGRLVLREKVVDVRTLLEKVCEQALQLERGQQICCHIQDNLPKIRADADRLQQVLLILVDNAIKFTPPDGYIELIARSEHPSAVIIEVRDTGIGVPASALPYVFDRFYRADAARTRSEHESRQQGGNGLGLAIARELVLAHGGEITLRSKEGEGTTVTIRLPASPT
jgi:two-component system OmpR family sensor kinase